MSMSNEEKPTSVGEEEVTDLMGNPLGLLEVPQFIASDWFSLEEGEEPELNKLTFEQILLVMKGTQGKVLTVIDATFTDEKRLKYVKDLVKEAFSQQTDWLFELATGSFEKPEEKK